MEKKLFNLFLVILGIVVLLLVFYLLFFFSFKADVVDIANITKNKTNSNAVARKANNDVLIEGSIKRAGDSPEEIKTRETDAQTSLKRTAAAFAERFGSFSNQSNFKNIDNISMFMTEDMRVWADKYVDEMRSKSGKINEYYGITTKAIFTEITEIDDDAGQATILVNTKRREAYIKMDNITNSFDQDIEIKFIKVENIWKVDSAIWQS